jgi:hypothetical protein
MDCNPDKFVVRFPPHTPDRLKFGEGVSSWTPCLHGATAIVRLNVEKCSFLMTDSPSPDFSRRERGDRRARIELVSGLAQIGRVSPTSLCLKEGAA